MVNTTVNSTPLRPTLQAAASAAPSAPVVASPHAAPAPPPAPADSTIVTAPVTVDTAAAAPEKSSTSRTAALVAAGLAAAVVAGVVGPMVGNAVDTLAQTPVTSLSVPIPGGAINRANAVLGQRGATPAAAATQTQGSTQADPAEGGQAQTQDLPTLIAQMAIAAEQSSQALPQVQQVHGQWGQDLKTMETTAQSLVRNVDGLMRGDASRQAAVQSDISRLSQQLGDFQGRLEREAPAVDRFVGQNRDNLNQIGTISYNLEQNINQAAGQYGYFTPQRKALRELGGDVHDATVDFAMATEKATAVRADNQALVENIKAVRQILDQVQQASQTARTDSNAMGQLDNGSRVLERAFKILADLTEQSNKDAVESATRAHQGAENLVEVYGQIAGGQAEQAPAAAR